MAHISISLFFTVLVCLLHITLAGVRWKRQDFVFPDDYRLRFIQQTPSPPFAMSTFWPPSSTTSSTRGPKTTPSQEYLKCFQNCRTTSEYNPVCGTDEQPYHNEQKLRCAQRCGQNVEMIRRGNCRGLFANKLLRPLKP